jgi:tetratricopeptide (TPR) repeat protein
MSSLNHIPLEAITLYRKALEMSGKGNHEQALKYLSNAVTIAPTFTTAICEMGYCYEKLGRMWDALLKFEKVLMIQPSHIEAEIKKDRILEKMRSEKLEIPH